MRSYTPKTLATRIITWMMVIGVALGSFQVAAPTQAASNTTSPAKSQAANAPGSKKVAGDLSNDYHKNGPVVADKATISDNLKGATGNIPLMIQLADDPVVVAQYAKDGAGKARNAQVQIAVNQKSKIEKAQSVALSALNSSKVKYSLLYQVKNTFNGIAVMADAKDVAALAKLPGVVKVERINTLKLDNAYSNTLINAPVAWGSYGITGTNVRVGIIDTGIDYIHTNFGGRGLDSDYTYAHTVTGSVVISGATQLYPTPKVVGGYDFAGDDYNADPNSDTYQPVPHPDQNPLDCSAALGGGHGSHVAGTTAGYGVNSDGTTFTGPYNESTPVESMRIGPGVAPAAKLYALRVFGCDGSTDLVNQAIDWAVDPDGNPATDDHLDVVNMSLGSDFGAADSSDSVAANNAVLAGVSMVISAGNAGDAFYVLGSPGSATRALTVASSEDAEAIVDGFKVTDTSGGTDISGIKPATRSAAYPWDTQTPPISVSLPVTAPLYYPTTNKSGCVAWTGADATNISGTVVLLDWATAPGATTFPCGSVTRGNNAEAAHAKGIIIVSGVAYFDTSITGAAHIPSMYTTSTTGDQIKTKITAGTVANNVQITFAKEYHNNVKFDNTGQNDLVSSFTSRGPQGIGNQLKPDIAAPGGTIFSTASGTGNQGETLSGTSMAAPHMSGVLALLAQQFPGWTPEEYKAAVMNTANHDVFSVLGAITATTATGPKLGQDRVGAGRVDVALAVTSTNQILAYNAQDAGAVSVSFGSVDVTGTTTLTKTVKVENKSSSSVTYNLSYVDYGNSPGVNYTFPDGASVTVAGNSSATFSVRLTAVAANMSHKIDPSSPLIQATAVGSMVRDYLTEAMGNVLLTPTTNTLNTLRVPVWASVRRASAMSASGGLNFTASNTANLNLTGTGVSEGFGSSQIPTATNHLVTPLELVEQSPKLNLTSNPPTTTNRTYTADLKDIGISSNYPAYGDIADTQIFFGFSTWNEWTLPNYYDAEFDLYIDTNNDGDPDYEVYNGPVNNGSTRTDITWITVVNLHTNAAFYENFLNGNYYSNSNPAVTNSINTNVFNNNVMVYPVFAADIGLTDANSSFSYWFQTYDTQGGTGQILDQSNVHFYDAAKPGLDFDLDGSANSIQDFLPYFADIPGLMTDVTIDKAAYAANGSQGVLLLHHFNTSGNRDEIVPVTLPAACATSTVVSVVSDDGSGGTCGTLSYALGASNGTTTTIIFNLPSGGKIINATGDFTYTVKSNVTLQGTASTCDPANNIVLNNQGTNKGVLLLSGGDTVDGLTLRGIKLVARTTGMPAPPTGPNKVKCTVIRPNGLP